MGHHGSHRTSGQKPRRAVRKTLADTSEADLTEATVSAAVSHAAELAKGHIPDAMAALVEVMNDPNEKGISRVAAAKAILERAEGRPAAGARPNERGGVTIVINRFDRTPAEKATDDIVDLPAEATGDFVRRQFGGANGQRLIEAELSEDPF